MRLKYLMLVMGILSLAAAGVMVWLVLSGQFSVLVRALFGS